jgi:shikimate dehydrogenase
MARDKCASEVPESRSVATLSLVPSRVPSPESEFRPERISAAPPMSTLRFAVFGHPIAHSLSPRLHALFAAQCGIGLEYLAIDATPEDFERAIRGFFKAGGRGANVTLPHKVRAFGLADVRTVNAERLGVANVLTLLPDGQVEADSNDGEGMLADLRARCRIDPRGCDVLLLGAGGAAKAAAFALLDAEVRTLVLANRTLERAEALVASLGRRGRLRALPWYELGTAGRFDLLVNATSAGVRRDPSPVLPGTVADGHTVAYDLSYGPAAQWFLDWANAAGCARACDGLGMLAETAAASFERWHGVRPDIDAALGALRRTLL